MSTTRLISAGFLFSLLSLASCGSVQVPYQMPEAGPRSDSSAASLPADLISGVDSREETGVAAGWTTDSESGELLDLDAVPAPYYKKASGGSKVNLAFLLGARSRDSNDWGVLDDQVSAGVEFSFVPKYFPIGVEVGLLYAFTSDTVGGIDLDGTTTELYFGPRFEWSIPEGTLKFFVGGGASLIRSDVDQIVGSLSQSFDDTTFGGYIHGGLELMLSKSFGIGFDLRGVFSEDATLNGVDLSPNYYQGALLFGLHF